MSAAEPANAARPAGGAATPPQDRTRPASANREKFGDRIARLIGTISPEDTPGEPQSAADPVEPVRPAAEAGHAAREPEPARSDWPPQDDDRSRDDHYHWHAASAGGRFEDGSRPLLDASILLSAVWRYRRLIGAATVAGAVLGVVVALATPHRYYAESRLFVDPREIRVTEDDIRNQQLSTEAMLAITDSQLQILSSTSVLEKVIADLGLDRDPEFNGSMSAGGISGGLTLIREILTGKSGASEAEQTALNNLRDAVYVGRDAKTFVIIVGVDTRDPEKSALIANRIVETYLDSEGQAQSNLLERTSESIDTRINSLRTDLDAAEREVERFKAENGLVGVGGEYIDDKVILALSDQLANARAMKVGIRVKADNLARVKIDDVLSGAFPEELLSANLSELRKQYTQTRSNADSLATRLGPRHPQYIAAKSSLDTITQEISAELRRIVASSQTELQRAVQIEQELASQMAVAKSRAVDQSVDLVTLRELERKATATRGIYEAFLTRSRETSERSNLSTRNVRVISPAEAPIQPMGPSRKIIAVSGMAAGFLAGVGLALLAGAVESIRAYNGAQPRARFETPPLGGYPEPSGPAPRTPPDGPGRRFWPRRGEDMDGRGKPASQTAAPAFHTEPPRSGGQPATSGPLEVEPATAQPASASMPAPALPESALNIQAAMPGHVQPQQPAPTQAPSAASPAWPQPHAGNPPWTAEPLQPQPLQQPEYRPAAPQFYPDPRQQPERSFHPFHASDPYAPVHPGYASGYAVPAAGFAAPAYPMPQPPIMPAPSHPQYPPYYLPQAYPLHQPQSQMPAQPYAAAYPTSPVYPPHAFPAAPAPQPVPQQVAPQAPVPSAQPASPADNEAVDRIRREMQALRARIDGYGAERRRA